MSIREAKPAITSGSVESSTSNSGNPSCRPKVLASTSGHNEEPPMPQTITWRKPRLRIDSANAINSSATPIISSATVNHPSEFSITRSLSGSDFHSDASLRHMRSRTSSSLAAASALFTRSVSGPDGNATSFMVGCS